MEYCGTEFTAWFIPEIFPESCRKHDVCYRTEIPRSHCDWLFYDNMVKEGNEIIAGVFFVAVVLFGGVAYRRSQKFRK